MVIFKGLKNLSARKVNTNINLEMSAKIMSAKSIERRVKIEILDMNCNECKNVSARGAGYNRDECKNSECEECKEC